MNGLERIVAAVRFERRAEVPAVPQIFGHAARIAGQPLRDYLTDGAVLARCQLAALARYRADAVFALCDVSVETEALGSRLRYLADAYPLVEHHVLADPADVAGLRVPTPTSAGRMPQVLAAARMLRNELGDTVLVAGCVLGPMTLACQLLGAERALYSAVDEPDAFERVLDFAVEVALAFGQAQLEAGAHLCIVFDPSASPAVVPPAFFHELLAHRARRLLAGLKGHGGIANWLHIAGPVLPLLPLYRECLVDIANIDYCAAAAQARAAVPGLCLDGNVRSLAFVEAEPAQIAAACEELLDAVGPGGFILSSGCEIPLEARPECIDALVAVARRREI